MPFPNPSLGPSPAPLTHQNTHSQYFVTEPNDNPPSPISNPTSILDRDKFKPITPLIEEISPNNSPIKKLPLLCQNPSLPSSTTLVSNTQNAPSDIALISSFSNLALKRKAVDEGNDPPNSKLLRLCTSIPNPNPEADVTMVQVRKKFKRGGAQLPIKKQKCVLQKQADNEDGLCDVPILQVFQSLENGLALVPSPSETQGAVQRKCSPSPLCPICNEVEETVEHTLFHCPWTKPIWFGSGKSYWVQDGLINSADSLAAFGVIARVSGGKPQLWRVGRIPAVSATSIEAWALRIACATAFELNLFEAIFESDCLEVINAVLDAKSSGPWEISTIIEDIKNWAKDRCWSFLWCCREQNKVAHCLADLCLKKNLVNQSGCIPHEVVLLLEKDVTG
ncbi:hypothetical protein RHMOL_Rhmol01G0251900 [Rhododendron molle]|uniref:Uncharacterized protein n=1 Tax=Rhododendron molle TaxID=49168 RepID=A0ACC0Q522_RHOML|nr:hypothetical protein RHMOL_Rhmol01G0251900 [Rhododendron molle]